ncbi:hypothetical protein L914_00860 [Phytophthora nicotianae]|uniref:Uncharacterized protein n=2 Tax=Phytophthora nicotianae TaxID=4792 RepID=V9FYN0_PHYNI|nr:hypothetical protein F443_00929 [Phytophthora nicotianae P1569]ETM56056.1 hypothetical protein L914_00860 [Phytophthora nicotianae]
MATATRSSKQRTHIMREKRDALQLASEIAQHESIFSFKGAQTSKTLKGRSRKETIPLLMDS